MIQTSTQAPSYYRSSYSAGHPGQSQMATQAPAASFDKLELDLARAARSFRDDLSLGKNGHSQTYYVFFTGLGDPTAQAADTMRDKLIAEGVPPEQILIIPNGQCTRLDEGGLGSQAWSAAVNLLEYGEAADPDSTQSHADEKLMKDYLKEKGYDPSQGDRVVLVGHSKGGQQALSVAERMERAGTPASQVVTLGTPVAHENLHQTPVTHVVALDDELLFGVTGRIPEIDVSGGSDTRVVAVSGGGHFGYCYDPKIFKEVVNRALRDPYGRDTGSDRIVGGKTLFKEGWDWVCSWFS